MSVPSSCTALVIGGGPGGSYAAAALAREGVDCVLLEADKFPRYHIGESMLASIRYFLRFIDLEKRFDEYGFTKKLGAAFKYSVKREAYTDFVAVNGPNGYAWNFIRSESDMLMFNYAGEMGARTFDQTKVEAIEFGAPLPDFPNDPKIVNPGRPVSAKWSRKDGSSGTIKFDYLVDASGRNGIMSTKYLKNRKFNQALKNVAHWGYWKGAKPYAAGTDRENQPMNEALEDASGWVWAIPLHDGTLSVGLVVRQDLFFERKKARNLGSGAEFYKDYLKLAPTVLSLVEGAELMPELKTASDYSYNSPAYAGPNFRIVGDAGCFIDPYFSSGVHLAISSALSAAMTIQAVRRGDCDEITAAKWHSSKVAEGYTRFLLIVMTAMLQIRRTEPVLSDFDEDGFDRAFGFFQPVIQGLADADVGGKLTDAKVSETVGFCLNAFNSITPAQRQAVLDKVQRVKANPNAETKEDLEQLDEEELKILQTIRARQMLRTEDTLHIENFSQDAIDGYAPRLKHGALGLNKVANRAAPPEYTESLFDTLEVRGQMGELVDSTLEVEA